MDWQTVQTNWPAFVEPIAQRWPGADEAELTDIDGDRVQLTRYIAEVTGQSEGETHEEIEAWLMGEVPADVLMDETRDNANIVESGRHISSGEDVYAEDGKFGSGDYGPGDTPVPPVGRDK